MLILCSNFIFVYSLLFTLVFVILARVESRHENFIFYFPVGCRLDESAGLKYSTFFTNSPALDTTHETRSRGLRVFLPFALLQFSFFFFFPSSLARERNLRGYRSTVDKFTSGVLGCGKFASELTMIAKLRFIAAR